ncbi:LolA family protein [Hypericibacter sp.]|uniref:LolA family protein n=1 Tax=Hypericibacter sp. TaxID=2705401 RepID=UPI003D6C7117
MKRLGLLFLMLFCGISNAVAEGPTSVRLSEGQVLRGQFVQERHLQGFDNPLRSEGRFVLAPGHGLIWQTEKPFAITTVITAAGLAQEVNGNQTLKLEASKLPFLDQLYDMLSGALTGDWAKLEAGFTVTRSGDDQLWQVALKPRKADDPGMPFTGIDATGSQFIDELMLTKPDGDFDKLSFHDQAVSDQPLTDAESAAFDKTGP